LQKNHKSFPVINVWHLALFWLGINIRRKRGNGAEMRGSAARICGVCGCGYGGDAAEARGEYGEGGDNAWKAGCVRDFELVTGLGEYGGAGRKVSAEVAVNMRCVRV